MIGHGGTDVPLPREFLDRLVSGVSVRVAVDLSAGDNEPLDWCTSRIDELDLACTDDGVDAALIGLVGRIRFALDHGLLEDCAEEHAPLVLRLHLASLDGTLGDLLARSAVLTGAYETDR